MKLRVDYELFFNFPLWVCRHTQLEMGILGFVILDEILLIFVLKFETWSELQSYFAIPLLGMQAFVARNGFGDGVDSEGELEM